MYAMQYEISLPADYDMNIIRRRVAEKGSALDAFDGLGLKAYLIRERSSEHGGVNQYAPFYLWSGIAGMARFLWQKGGFFNIINSFGRPPVRHWTGAGFSSGTAASAGWATRRTFSVPPDADPAPVVAEAADAVRKQAEQPGVYASALAVDPAHWEAVHFTLWEDKPGPSAAGTVYEVLHLSQPDIGALEEYGRIQRL